MDPGGTTGRVEHGRKGTTLETSDLEWIGDLALGLSQQATVSLATAMLAHGEDPDDAQLWKDRKAQIGYSVNSFLTAKETS